MRLGIKSQMEILSYGVNPGLEGWMVPTHFLSFDKNVSLVRIQSIPIILFCPHL
jgi:hypothetical protein